MLIPFLSAIALLSYVSRSQFACSNWDSEITCNLQSDGKCKWIVDSATPNGECKCASTINLDILFAIDTSGSIGLNNFETLKSFIGTLTSHSINTDSSKIGFITFSTQVNFSRSIQSWETESLRNYISGLHWNGGWTNTPEVIRQSIAEFDGNIDPARQQILILITDGAPCLPEALGGCPQSICQYRTQVNYKAIRIIIVSVGDKLKEQYVQCLTQTDEDLIPVNSFAIEDFDSIMGSLSDVLCPTAIQFKVTEAKAMRKPSSWSNTGDARFTRFIEIYNTGIDFNLNAITSTGFLVMPNGGPDLTVSQGQYVVFYDAADLPAQVSGAVGPGMPSCHLCGDDCDLSSCGISGDQNQTGYCWCGNSIYVACNNDADTDCSQGMEGDAVHDACSNGKCTFNNGMTKMSWNIAFHDANGDFIDGVIYTGDPDWITTDDKYSYELQSKGLDNDVGGYWGQSCSSLGTPGADPAVACEASCIENPDGCGGDANINTCQPDSAGQCDCDPSMGYYPHCTSPTSCTKCLQVPTIADCEVVWTKNGTTHRAVYTWNIMTQSTAVTRYILSHYAKSEDGGIKVIGIRGNQSLDACTNCIWESIYATTDYYNGNTTFGGYVQVAIDVCQQYTDNSATCSVYFSEKTMCLVVTAPPTESPTPAPTHPPSHNPTLLPSMPPTNACPEYFWVGGTQQKICSENDRCNCYVGEKDCCLLPPVFYGGFYDEDRRHHEKDWCKLDVQYDEHGDTSPGYLLTAQTHSFAIDIMPEDYDCAMDIYWRFEWQNTDCNYDPIGGRRRRRSRRLLCDAGTNGLEQAGLAIDVQGGWLHPVSAINEEALTVEFTVSQLECESGDGCFDNVALYGRIVIVNATSQCRPDCYDGRIYPMEIPVWYNYADTVYIPPIATTSIAPTASTQIEDTELTVDVQVSGSNDCNSTVYLIVLIVLFQLLLCSVSV